MPSRPMRYKLLGRSGLRVSELAPAVRPLRPLTW